MADSQFKRNIAFQLRVGDVLMGKPVVDGENFSFLELGEKRIVRVNIIGNIVIQATLANPATVDNQWFDVYDYTGIDNPNATQYTNVTGNFVYMRAKVVDFQQGVVGYIKLSY